MRIATDHGVYVRVGGFPSFVASLVLYNDHFDNVSHGQRATFAKTPPNLPSYTNASPRTTI